MTGPQIDDRFWQSAERLIASSELVIDRPRGSRHPRFDSILYPLDYGYLAGTSAVDGHGIDVWVGSQPELGVVGILATVDLFKRDAEIKLLLGCTAEEVLAAHRTSNSESQSAMLVRRPPVTG